jgi:hypothetical protein
LPRKRYREHRVPQKFKMRSQNPHKFPKSDPQVDNFDAVIANHGSGLLAKV